MYTNFTIIFCGRVKEEEVTKLLLSKPCKVQLVFQSSSCHFKYGIVLFLLVVLPLLPTDELPQQSCFQIQFYCLLEDEVTFFFCNLSNKAKDKAADIKILHMYMKSSLVVFCPYMNLVERDILQKISLNGINFRLKGET